MTLVAGIGTVDGAVLAADGAGVTTIASFTLGAAAKAPMRWTETRERGIAGLVPAEPEPWFANVALPAWTHSPVVDSGQICPPVAHTTYRGQVVAKTVAAPALKSGQVSRLTKIARDWSRQAQQATSYSTDHTVENGAVILNQPPPVSFQTVFTSYVLNGSHHLVPKDKNGEHAWFQLWRLRAARHLLRGGSADALLTSLSAQLAELRANVVSLIAAAPRRLNSQLVRLAHFIDPQAPPAHLVSRGVF